MKPFYILLLIIGIAMILAGTSDIVMGARVADAGSLIMGFIFFITNWTNFSHRYNLL